MNIDQLLVDYRTHKDDPEYLSNMLIELAASLFHHNTQTADYELSELQEATNLLTTTDPEAKKVSVAEAEKRAVVATNNNYGRSKKQGEALIELLNAIKVRIKTLMNERDNQ